MMTVLPFAFAALLALDLLRRVRGVPSSEAASILFMVIPRALLLVAVAVTIGAWPLRAAFVDISSQGSGGAGPVVVAAERLASLSLAGAIACALLLTTGIVLMWRVRTAIASDDSEPVRPIPAAAVWTRAAASLVALLLAAYGLIAAERTALMAVAPFAERLAVPLTVMLSPSDVDAGQATLARLVAQLTTGGAVLAMVLLVQTIATVPIVRRRSVPRALLAVLPLVSVAIVLFAAWRALRLSAAVGWIAALADRITG
jgi:hypothetical protein